MNGRMLKGVLGTSLYVVTTLSICLLIFPLALLKGLVPPWRVPLSRALDALASAWIELNNCHQRLLTGTEIRVDGDLAGLSREQWYLMVANHQSWVDILILIRVLNGRIPYVKFFFKKQLLWVPVFGLALWALDFPVMRRHSRAQVERNPDLRHQDMEQTRRACEIYRHNPVTIVTFPEGTRFTPAKQRAQGAAYRHLLAPKAGGMAFTLSAMEGRLRQLLDVTIAYPDYPEGRPSYWDYACGRVRRVHLHLHRVTLGDDLMGDYERDPAFRQHFQNWLNRLWEDKDRRLADMLDRAR